MRALSNRNFRVYFLGQSVSSLGTAMVPVALAFAILRLTHSAGDLGLVLTAQAVASLVFILWGGVISDRISRRLALIGSDSTRLVAQGVLAGILIAGRPPFAAVLVLALVQGIGTAVFNPASTGLVPALVPDEDLQAANSLLQTVSSAAFVAGPVLAGVLVVAGGPGWALAFDAFSYLVSVTSLLVIRLPPLERADRKSFMADLREGWGEFRRHDWYWKLVLAASTFNALFALYIVLGPVASTHYYSGARSWAVIVAAGGLGSVIGGLVATKIRPTYPLRFSQPLLFLFVMEPLAVGLAWPVPVAALMAALGWGGLITNSSLLYTTVQRHIPERLLSRVIAYDWFGSLVAVPIGLAAAAPLAGVFGVRLVLVTAAGLAAVNVVATLLVPSIWRLRAAPETPAAGLAPDVQGAAQ